MARNHKIMRAVIRGYTMAQLRGEYRNRLLSHDATESK